MSVVDIDVLWIGFGCLYIWLLLLVQMTDHLVSMNQSKTNGTVWAWKLSLCQKLTYGQEESQEFEKNERNLCKDFFTGFSRRPRAALFWFHWVLYRISRLWSDYSWNIKRIFHNTIWYYLFDIITQPSYHYQTLIWRQCNGNNLLLWSSCKPRICDSLKLSPNSGALDLNNKVNNVSESNNEPNNEAKSIIKR